MGDCRAKMIERLMCNCYYYDESQNIKTVFIWYGYVNDMEPFKIVYMYRLLLKECYILSLFGRTLK